VTLAIAALIGLLLFTAIGQLLFKYGTTSGNVKLTLAGFGSLAAATVSSFLALRTLGIGLVYLSMGLTHILIMLGSWYLLGESISRQRVLGSVLVVAGIFAYAISL